MADNNDAFTGSIPEYYDKYLGPLFFEDYSIDLARRLNLPAQGALLEIAAGTGRASRHFRKFLPESVSIMITDLNEAMLDVAKLKLAKQVNVRFQSADATELPFPNSSFDAIACQFGIMFFPDKQKAVDEIYRVLKPESNFLFSVWDSYAYNPLIKLVNDSLIQMFPENPPSFLNVPLGYFDINEIQRVLQKSGFTEIDIAILPRTIRMENAQDAPLGFIKGNPLSLQITELGGDLDQVINTIAQKIVETFGDPPIEAPMQAIVFNAHKN